MKEANRKAMFKRQVVSDVIHVAGRAIESVMMAGEVLRSIWETYVRRHRFCMMVLSLQL